MRGVAVECGQCAPRLSAQRPRRHDLVLARRRRAGRSRRHRGALIKSFGPAHLKKSGSPHRRGGRRPLWWGTTWQWGLSAVLNLQTRLAKTPCVCVRALSRRRPVETAHRPSRIAQATRDASKTPYKGSTGVQRSLSPTRPVTPNAEVRGRRVCRHGCRPRAARAIFESIRTQTQGLQRPLPVMGSKVMSNGRHHRVLSLSRGALVECCFCGTAPPHPSLELSPREPCAIAQRDGISRARTEHAAVTCPAAASPPSKIAIFTSKGWYMSRGPRQHS